MSIELATWHWNWSEVCPTGLTPWIPDTNELSRCFQEICLQLPILFVLAVVSSYSCGKQAVPISRNRIQVRCIKWRSLITFVQACVPLWRIYVMITQSIHIWPINVMVACTESLAWSVHLCYLLSLRHYGEPTHRGSLYMRVVWVSIFTVHCAWLETTLRYDTQLWPIGVVVLHVFYGITLIPKGESVIQSRDIQEEEERQFLVRPTYVQFSDNIDEIFLGPAQDNASCFSSLFFNWVEPLIAKGVLGKLRRIDDLFDLPECLTITSITDKFQHSIESTRTLFRTLHRSFGKEFYLVGILRLIADLSGFAGPLLLNGLLQQGTSDATGTDFQPYLYAMGLFGVTVLSAICGTHFNWRISLVTMKMRMAVVTAIYRKALDVQALHDANSDILNLMSTDTDRIVNSCISFHSLWSIPFQLFVSLYLLYTQVGAAFLAGVAFAVVLIPINRYIAVKIGSYSKDLMEAKDKRISLTSEVMAGAKQIKLLAWEDVFLKKIDQLRQEELKFLSKRKYLDALCVYFWATTPILMCLLTFGVSVLMGQTLTAATTFTSVALLNMLIGPLNAFPWVLNGVVESWVSLKRVQQLIDLPDIDLGSYYSPLSPSKNSQQSQMVLQIENATFQFKKLRLSPINEECTDFQLDDINLDVYRGDLICIEGPVGGGKTMLLSALLGSLECVRGTISISNLHAGFGYVSQNSWIQRGTIRDNILWGSVMDENFYKKVIWACALNDDINALGDDLASVGEGGHTLSGGQRMRVALARAVYQNKSIYILDDILAALDVHVAAHIVKHCLLNLLKTKTRIIVTDNKTLNFHANQIIRVEDGKTIPVNLSDKSFDTDDNELEDDAIAPEPNSTNFEYIELSHELDLRSIDSIRENETKVTGTLRPQVLRSYLKAMSSHWSICVLVSVVLMQASKNGSDAWLAHWVTDKDSNRSALLMHVLGNSTTTTVHSTSYYLGVYTGLAVGNSVLTLLRAFLFAYAGIKAAKFINQTLLKRVLNAKFQFFDVAPLGRILNRFSSDTYTIDDSLPFILNILLAQFAGLIGALFISLYAMPWLWLLIVPMCPIYYSIQNRYRHSSRDIKRLSSNALSPLYAHFTETLQGIVSIRAMRGSKRFQHDFLGKLEESLKAQMTAAAAQQWLGIRLQMMGSVLVGATGLLAAITSQHATNPGLVGLAISYALSITSLLGGVLSSLSETEQEMIAVERVNQYCQLEGEVMAEGSISPPFGWPCQGTIQFENVHLRYRPHLSPSLRGINLKINTCDRVGIVGRTGAGKSSILAALMRVAPVSQGTITIDCVNISNLSLNTLRSRLAIVPQDPFLFSGTIRENLDPRNTHIDSEIWHAVTTCLATPLIQSLGGLSGQIEATGANLSAGQKQLLCLSRAFLKRSKIVFIDEGMANLDAHSEATIQFVLKNAFKASTVLFIAHRLPGLQGVDKIVVVDSGHVVEEGVPSDLDNDHLSIFHRMMSEQNM